MTKKNITIALPCGHVFHTKCIKEALRHNKKCPLCRRVITNVPVNALETRRKSTFRNVVFRPLQLLRNLYYARTRRNRQAQDRRRIEVINALEASVAANNAVNVIERRLSIIRSRLSATTERSANERSRLIDNDLQIEHNNLREARERSRLASERAETMYQSLPVSMRP